MDPINSWVDAAEMRRLAESLVAPVAGPAETPAAAYGQQFVGFEKAPPAPVAPAPVRPAPVEQNAREALAGAREAAERGGILQQVPPAQPSPAPMPQAAPRPAAAAPVQSPPRPATGMAAPQGYLMERLKAYGEWLHREVLAKAFFVADRSGELLIDEVQSQKLLHVARTLAQASWTASRQAGADQSVGSLHVKLGAGSVMEVLTVSSRYGPLILGIIVPSLLPAASIRIVAEGLERVVNAPIQRS